jgi:ATP-dependent helicase/nuclease subunit A
VIPSDLQIRKQALAPEHSFIVQAPAGSGKTELLIQRYLKLLSGVGQPEEILAMTFTRKASGEMKTRIFAALTLAQSESPPEEEHQHQTWSLARAALERDRKFGWRLLDNPARLRVVTIDSFCTFLTKRTPLLSKMGGPTEIQKNIQDLYLQTAKQILSKIERKDDLYAELTRTLLAHLDNDKSAFLMRIVQLLKLRDQWMISFFDKFENIKEHLLNDLHRDQLAKIYSELIEKQLKGVRDHFPLLLQENILSLASYSGENLAESAPENPIASLKGLDSFPLPLVDELEKWKGVSKLLLTASGELRKTANKNLGFPADKNAHAIKMKESFAQLLESLGEHKPLVKALARIDTLPSPHFTDHEWNILRSTIRLLPEIDFQLRSILQEKELTDFSEISLAALKAFGNELNPTDLDKYLDDKIQHILVDEYQDTSYKQEELLKKLTAEWEPGKGRSLFIVGDPKQSIYRFRDAEVGLFLKTQENGIGHLKLKNLTLESNFRSQERVVTWVNECFQKILPSDNNPNSGAIAFSKSTAVHASESYPGVILHPLNPNADPHFAAMEEAHEVSKLIKKIQIDSPTASIAILVRSRTHLKGIIRELESNHIPFKAEAIYTLTDRPAIIDLLSLMRTLLSPLDRIAWLSILRAPWAGMSLSDLHLLCGESPEKSIWELLCDESLIATLSSTGQQQVKRITSVLLSTLNALPSNNFRDLLENCWIRLGGPACLEETPPRDIESFFDEVESIMQKGEISKIEHFNQVIENLYASPSTIDENAVQVMTMHKAKGLEFDYVILPGLGKRPRPESKQLVFWMPYGDELLLAPIEEKGGNHSPIYNFLADMDKEKDDHEMLRLLYVAATRARKQLHLFGKTKNNNIPESKSLLESLWPFIKNEWSHSEPHEGPQEDKQGVTTSETISLKRIPAEFTPPTALPDIDTEIRVEIDEEKNISPFLWAGNTARCLGNVLHRILQTITEEGLSQWPLERIDQMAPKIKAALLGEGLPFEQSEKVLQQTLLGIRNTLKDPKGQWILASHDEGHAEYPLTRFAENRFFRKIIDRTFIENDIRWIIDYKTSRHEGKGMDLEEFLSNEVVRYKPQLDSYATLLKEYGESRPIKKALYFPMLKAWRVI